MMRSWGGAPRNGVSVLLEETPERSLSSSARRGHGEKSARTRVLVLGHPDSRTVQSERLL